MKQTQCLNFKLIPLFIAALLFLQLISAQSALAATDAARGVPLNKPTAKVILRVDGLITQTNASAQAQFDLAMIQALPAATIYTSTVVTDGIKRFDGVLVRELLNVLGLSTQAQSVEASALNDYLVDIPLADFYKYDVLLATHMDGVLLQPIDKGPLWLVYPRDSHRKLQDIRYDYRWVWQLKHLHIH